MNRPSFPYSAGSAAHGAEAPAAVAPALSAARLRAVHRAATDLRRGIPVVLAADPPLLLLAAETTSVAGLDEFTRLIAAPPVLLLAPVRAAAVLRRPVGPAGGPPVALALPESLLAPEPLARLADPVLEQALPTVPKAMAAPAGAPAALALAKLARLLPAVLAAPLAAPLVTPLAGAVEGSPLTGLLCVSAEDVLAYRPAAAASLRRLTEAQVPLSAAPDARIVIFRPADGGTEHLAILVGNP
ncbi:MAG: GTP cyclohydrolase II, partial [Acetobacteraceae bacterium]